MLKFDLLIFPVFRRGLYVKLSLSFSSLANIDPARFATCLQINKYFEFVHMNVRRHWEF